MPGSGSLINSRLVQPGAGVWLSDKQQVSATWCRGLDKQQVRKSLVVHLGAFLIHIFKLSLLWYIILPVLYSSYQYWQSFPLAEYQYQNGDYWAGSHSCGEWNLLYRGKIVITLIQGLYVLVCIYQYELEYWIKFQVSPYWMSTSSEVNELMFSGGRRTRPVHTAEDRGNLDSYFTSSPFKEANPFTCTNDMRQ